MKHKKPFCIIIYGPTASGKTELANRIAKEIPAEIINMDMGQLYQPLSIGTAKPDWQHELVAHHLFDVITQPKHFSVSRYRQKVKELIESIYKKNKIPILVGGSGFYLSSLFFPPQVAKTQHTFDSNKSNEELWQQLYEIDQERAKQIHVNDRYRIERALAIWHETGKKPSLFKPQFEPVTNCLIVWLDRDKKELHERIKQRTNQMIQDGWIEEVEGLDGQWQQFLKKKQLIGYNDIIDFLQTGRSLKDREKLLKDIIAKTKAYAKRQNTFWKMVKKKIIHAQQVQSKPHYQIEMIEVPIDQMGLDFWIQELLNKVTSFKKREVNE